MDCREIEKLLTLYLDGEISRTDARELENHVKHCRRCTVLLEDAMELKDLVRKIPMEKAPRDLRRQIELQIALAEKRSHVFGILRWSAVAAVFVLAIYGVYAWIFPRTVVKIAPVALQADAQMPYEDKSMASTSVRPAMAPNANRMDKLGPSLSRLKKRMIPPTVLENLVVEHVRPLPPEIQTTDAESVARWYASKSGFYAPPPQLASWGGRMEGGRMSRFHDREAVQLFYSVNGKRVTVFMFRADMIEDIVKLDSLEQLDLTTEEEYVNTTPGGRLVALFSHNGIGYSVITDAEADVMRQIVRTIVSQTF